MKLADVLYSSSECVVCLNMKNSYSFRCIGYNSKDEIFWKSFARWNILEKLKSSKAIESKFISMYLPIPFCGFGFSLNSFFLSLDNFSLFSYHYECFFILWICFILLSTCYIHKAVAVLFTLCGTVMVRIEPPWAESTATYSISQEICTRFSCALLCCGYAIVHNEFTLSIYPYSSGLLLLALGQSLDCHSASEVSLMDMGKSVNV